MFTVDYGQRAASAEMGSASQIAVELCIPHRALTIDCNAISRGDMSRSSQVSSRTIYSEWWPFRNQILATFAAAYFVEEENVELMFGTVSSDSVHADGTQAFFTALNALLREQEGGVSVTAPAIAETTESLIRRSGVSDSVLALSFSCHRGNLACGMCRGCLKRRFALGRMGRQR